MWWKRAFWPILSLLIAAPFFLNSYLTQLLSEIYLFAIFAMSLDLMLGYTGLPSLGHGAFFGLGAYSAAILTVRFGLPFGVTVALALLILLVASLLVGYLCVRVSGASFLMLTLAFSQMFYVVAHKWSSVTGGPDGLPGIERPVLSAAGFTLDLSEAFSFNYFTLFSAVAAYLFLRRIVGSPLGAVLVGIRENEQRMRSMGFPVRKFQLCSFVLSSLLAGVSGSLYAFFNGFVSPQELYWPTSATVLIMVVLGGAGTLAGPALGAAFVLAFQSVVSSYSERWPMFLGAVFASFVLFAREGLAGLARRRLEGVDWKR